MRMINPKKVVSAVLAAVLCIFIIYYMYRQVIGISKDKVETENAVPISIENMVSSTGYIMRYERVLDAVGTGTVFSVVDDGEKVSAGMAVANVYSSEEAAAIKSRIDEIDEKLDILESSIVDQEYFSADVGKLEQDRNEILDSILKNKAENNFEDCIISKDKLLISMNKLSSVKNGGAFEEQISELQEERLRLASAQGETYTRIFAPEPGYYTGIVDGYEKIFSPEILETMTISDFERLTQREPDNNLISSNSGKLVTDSRWYICCELDKNEAQSFEEGEEYTVEFPYSEGVSLKMELLRAVRETDRNETVLVFTTDEMPSGFGYVRSQKIDIARESYSGLRVPKSAMRKLNNETDGVYILVGETVRFRRAEVIYELDDYYIVRYESEAEKTQNAVQSGEEAADESGTGSEQYRYLSLYDSVIVSGKDLYDGKQIN